MPLASARLLLATRLRRIADRLAPLPGTATANFTITNVSGGFARGWNSGSSGTTAVYYS